RTCLGRGQARCRRFHLFFSARWLCASGHDFHRHQPRHMTTPVKRILLVEDSEHDIELTITALDGHHLANKVDVARDGAEALDYLYKRGAFATRSDGPPIVVLLDLKMPRVDGLEVLRQMKSDPELRYV